MNVKELLKESVVGEHLDEELGLCVLIPKGVFKHIVDHLIPRDPDEE